MVSFGSPIVEKKIIWPSLYSEAVSHLAKFIDKFEDATYSMRRGKLGRRLIEDTIEDRRVAQKNSVTDPKTEVEKYISTGIFSSDKYRATYLGGGVSGDAYRVQVDGTTKYVIKEAKEKKCSDPIDGQGGINHEYDMLEKFKDDSEFQRGVAIMKTRDGNYFLVSKFEQGQPAGINGNSFNRLTRVNIAHTLDILSDMDKKRVFNADWNLGNIFYQGGTSYPKMLDLQWAYSMSEAHDLYHFVPGETETNMVTFEASSIAQYLHHLYEYNINTLKESPQKGKTETRDFLKMYLMERARHCDTSNRFESLRKSVYENPTEDVLDAEILRLSILKNHNRQFVYVDKRNEEPRDMLIMIRYQARANLAAKMLEEFKPQKDESQMSKDEKAYFEEMRKFGQDWHGCTKRWYSDSIYYMTGLVTGKERQTTGSNGSGLFYFPELFGSGVTGKGRRSEVPDQTKLSDVLSHGAKAKWDDIMEKSETINYRGRDITLPSLKTQIMTLEGKIMTLKNAVANNDYSAQSDAKQEIFKLIKEVLI